jgi:tetratricopeptide (TPR) repeat protein/O-antigen ligase
MSAALTRRLRFVIDGVSLSLTGLLLLTLFQLIPLPLGVVRVVSPTAARLHEIVRPNQSELLSEENPTLVRSTALPLSVDPEATRMFAVRLASILIVYAAVRSWIATRGALKRMAWTGMIIGTALSLFAVGQFLSSPHNTIYWSITTGGSVFGPFVNRNHYIDYIALCIGWTLALLLTRKTVGTASQNVYGSGPLDFLTKPVALAAAISLGLMILSVLLCLSRGGLISVFAAGLAVWFGLLRPEGRQINRVYLLVFLLAIGAGAYYFGAKPLEERYHAANVAPGADDRLPLWRGALGQVPGFYLLGSGNGSFPRVEPLARPQIDQPYLLYTHAHNEYVEALIEGGVVRFAFTIALIVALVFGLGRGYRRRADRIVGPYLIGIWFGLFVLIVHAFTDFGIHITAVGLLAAVSAGFGMAAANDADFGAQRQRKRTSHTTEAPNAERAEPRESQKPSAEFVFHGFAAIAVSGMVALVGLVTTLDINNYAKAEEYLFSAMSMGRPSNPRYIERKLTLLRTATALRPNQSTYHFELGKAQIEAAFDLAPMPFEAVAGTGAVRLTPMDRLPATLVEQLIVPALNELRTARNLSPLYPNTQLLLGQYRQYFAKAEPRLVYLERAKVLNRADPNIWYACGVEELAAGNDTAACDNWRRSLELSPQNLPQIITSARKHWNVAEVMARILPDSPAIFLQAADMYIDEPAARKALLVKAADAAERTDWDWKQRIAIAKAAEALGRYDAAAALWKATLDMVPEQYEVHNGAAEFYEREERYDEALTHLSWMIRKSPGNASLRDRELAAKHGVDLKAKLKE